MVYKRCESFLSKEPETIEWISTFSSGETLFDIGANIGLYSLLAAKKGLRVVAFEPESQNYAVLNANVHLNSLDQAIASLNIALSNRVGLDYLYVPVFSSGISFNQLGFSPQPASEQLRSGFKQAVFSYTLDRFIEAFPDFFPNHLKIDVDGIEGKIISCASRTMAHRNVKSMLVEMDLNLKENEEAIQLILSNGFKVLSRSLKVGLPGVYNYIFGR
jgi:FkbM family methyltransferase